MDLQKTFRKVSKYFTGGWLSGASLWGWAYPGEWKRADLLKQYTRYVYAIVSAIAEDAAKINLEVEKMAASGTMMPVLKHPFLDLIKKPNPDQSQFQFLEMHFTFVKLMGESFWYLLKGENSKKPKEIYLLRPDLMDVVIDKDDPRGLVKGYVMKRPDGKDVPFEKDEILHFKMPNPIDPYRGLGTVQAAKVYVETEDFASHFTRNSIYNSGRPSGVLNVKGTIDKDEFEQIKKQFKDQYSGTKNAGKTMLLRGADGLDYQKLGMELGEVGLKELKDMTRDDIMVMFRVSKTILGITDDVNRANAHEARAVFTENVIKPELDRFIDHINAFLMPVWSDGFVLNYEDPTLVSDKDKLEEWTAGHNKWLTTNDIREERGLDPLPGGDVIREPINLVPTTTPVPLKTLKKRLKKKDSSRKVRADIFMSILFTQQEMWERRYKRLMDEEFETQKKEILNKHRGKSATKDLDEWLFSILASKQRLMGVLVPLGLELMADQAKPAFDMAGDDETVLIVNDRIRKYIVDRVDHLADETSDFTVKEITDSLSEGILAGEALPQLRKRIEAIYDNATSVRSERIARTETLAASNEGALAAYRQSPLVKKMEWSAEADACEFCLALDGTVVGLEEEFLPYGSDFQGLDGGNLKIDYSSITHPPLHPNCRCAILPVG